jgi:hypothetical protein
MGYDVTPEAQPRCEQRRCSDDARPVPVLVPQHPDVPRCYTGTSTAASLRRGRGRRRRRKLRRSVSDAVRVEVAYD